MIKKENSTDGVLSVYTATYGFSTLMPDACHGTIGTYSQRNKALDACVYYILKHLETWDAFAYAVANDRIHPKLHNWFHLNKRGFLAPDKDRSDDLYSYLRDELGEQGYYRIVCDLGTFRFDVDEVAVEGAIELQTAVITLEGADDNIPEPHTFLTQAALNSWARDYIGDYWRDTHNGRAMSSSALQKCLGTLRKAGSVSLALKGRLKLNISAWSQTINAQGAPTCCR